MKQLKPPATGKIGSKPAPMSMNASTPSRVRPKIPKESPGKPESRPKTVPLDVKDGGKTVRRFLGLSKAKSGEQPVVGSLKVVEQFARPRRLLTVGTNRKSDEFAAAVAVAEGEKKSKELSEALIKDLQDEVLSLKAELDKAHCLNVKLEAMNKELGQKLAAAEVKIAAFESSKQRESRGGEYQSPKFKDIQKLIANKLEQPKSKREAIKVARPVEMLSPAPPPPLPRFIVKVSGAQKSAPVISSLPPPPPPPPPPGRVATVPKAPSPVQFNHSLTKQVSKKELPVAGNHNKPTAISIQNSIVGEIRNRSTHLMAIKADIETKGEFINSLIQKILDAAYTDIEDVLKFVDWLDIELSSLADERAVLKHFKWPERKADAMREAAVEYRDLKSLETEISSYKDDPCTPCAVALKKMAGLLDKSEQSLKRLIKLRNSVLRSYQDWKIPVDWMLDSGIMSKIKQASMKLATMYIKRVAIELEFARRLDRESTQEALLLQGMHFAYRAHQVN